MKKLLTAFSCVIVSASLLLSCSSSSSSSSSSPAAKRFETVLEMRDAFIGAGGDCPNWQISTVKLALSSGTCSDTDVLSVYSSRAVAEEQNSLLKKLITETFPDSLNDTLTQFRYLAWNMSATRLSVNWTCVVGVLKEMGGVLPLCPSGHLI